MSTIAGDATAMHLDAGRRAVAWWLLVCCAMVAAMVAVGGITRLTESGLSMVEWRPLIGALPPLSEAEWQRVFAAYQASPEFRKVTGWMTLVDFRRIFWWEYVHRLLGRLIGVVFVVPFLWFLLRGRIDGRLGLRLGGILALGGLQALAGWWMVRSGLGDDPFVSQYRLAVHLGLAVLIYALLFRTALGQLLGPPRRSRGDRFRSRLVAGLALYVFVLVLSGALVAGLDAGLVYNSFPLMDGSFVPPGYGAFEPFVLNFFENHGAVQFNHRWMAITGVVLILGFCAACRGVLLPGRGRLAIRLLGFMAVAQMALGIGTLLLQVPVALAVAHQMGALLLLTVCLWTQRELEG